MIERWSLALGATLLLLAAAAAGGCRRNAGSAAPPRPALGVVSVKDVTPEPSAAAALDVGGLERELRARLHATKMFADGDAAAGDASAGAVARARVQVATESAEVGDKGVARAHVLVRIDTRPDGSPGAIDEQLEGQGERRYAVSDRPGPSVYTALVTRVMGDLIDGLAARRRLQDGPPAAVHAALQADGGELREEAIHVAGQRQLRDEVPTLLKLLSDPDEQTRDAALGALIAMRERRAVPELTRRASLRDRREMRKILEAIAILGGQEAEEYLSFVAETHDDEEIRAEAAAAKARLQRHADAEKRP
jgi:hypothetical protein